MTEKNLAGFKPNFTWGAATAAYQIEGAHDADGKGPSVWDQMAHTPGKVYQGHTGDVACDHYHRYLDDVALMADLGLKGYRFSLSWSRILPSGTGQVNQAGLDFYSRLVDALLDHNIEPWVTLFHWDFPLALYRHGGWLNELSPDWFAEYTSVVVKALGDRVAHWITLNEPQMFVWLGHQTGEQAPGLKLSLPELVRISHHALLAHGKACQVLRSHGGDAFQIGWAPATSPFQVDDPKDKELVAEAARRTFIDEKIENFTFGNPVWNDAAFRGHYPDHFLAELGHFLPETWEADLKTIAQPIDFCGLNIYMSHNLLYRKKDGSIARRTSEDYGEGFPRNQLGWPITPEALYWGPRFFYERYGLPIVITENGTTLSEWKNLDGEVQDASRVDFIRRYLSQLKRAAQDGVEINGYFHWSLMDNYEWAEGYQPRFGLVHVDFKTQQRTIKSSGHFYRDIIAANGAAPLVP